MCLKKIIKSFDSTLLNECMNTDCFLIVYTDCFLVGAPPQPTVSNVLKVVVRCDKEEDRDINHILDGPVLKADTQVLCDKKERSDRPKRQLSCPPMATQSVSSGPWSLEWLKDHVHGEAGVVSSSNQASKQHLRS